MRVLSLAVGRRYPVQFVAVTNRVLQYQSTFHVKEIRPNSHSPVVRGERDDIRILHALIKDPDPSVRRGSTTR